MGKPIQLETVFVQILQEMLLKWSSPYRIKTFYMRFVVTFGIKVENYSTFITG